MRLSRYGSTWKAATGFSDFWPGGIYSTFTTGPFTRGSTRWTSGSMKSGSVSPSNIDGSGGCQLRSWRPFGARSNLSQERASGMCDPPKPMTERMLPNVEVIDLAPGLWIWRLEHPAWNPDVDWQQVVTCVCVDAGTEGWLLDPLLPPDEATEVWDRLAQRPPTAVAVLSPDHMRRTWGDRQTRSVDAVVRRYGCRAFGPGVFDPDDGPPETELQTILPNHELPGGLLALRDPRGWNETPLWLPEHHTLLFAHPP